MLEHDVVGPPIHLLAVAAVPLGARRLPLAFRTVGRAIETDMKVPVMPQPRLNLGQPRAIVTRVTAERFFDRGVREYAIDARILSRGLDQRDVCRGPSPRRAGEFFTPEK